MHNLNLAFAECKKELDNIGIPYGNIKEIVPNKRAKTRWGQCKKSYDGTYSINISTRLLDDNTPYKSLKDTIIHEMIHTCPKCMNHGLEWKQYADKVNYYYKYNIKRTNTSEEKGVSPIIDGSKYLFKCKNCGTIIARMRESHFTRHPELYLCGVCGGKIVKINK